MKHLTIVRWGTLRLLALVLSLMVTGLGMIPGLDGPGSGGAAHAQSATMPAASADGGLQGVRLAHSSMTSSAGRDPAQALCPLEDSAWRMGRLALEAPISWRVEEAATAARIEPGSLDGGSQLLLAQTQAPLKCDRSAACRTVGALLKLISSQNGGPDPGAFARFTQKFDPAFGRLWHKELACRFDTVPQFAGTTPLLGRIHRDRMGLKTLNARASFPGSTLCAYKAMSQEKHPVLPRPGEKEGCEDVEAIQRISTNLEQLGSMLKCTSAEEARSGVEPRLCPETTVLEHIKQRADEAGRVTKVLARVAADKAERDADLRTALETTQDGFEKVSSYRAEVRLAMTPCATRSHPDERTHCGWRRAWR